MSITIKSITKVSDGRLRVTVEDSAQVMSEFEGVPNYKTYSFYVSDNDNLTPEQKAVEAKANFEKAIQKDKKKISDYDALKQVYATELAKVDPSQIGG